MEIAAILKLNNAQERPEHSVIYITNRWEQLLSLLRDPSGFFLSRTMVGDPEWKVNLPLTAVLDSGRDAKYLLRSAILAQQFVKRDLEKNPSKPDSAKESSVDKALSPDALNIVLDEAFPDGGFMAEFAIDTRTVIVKYFLPLRPEREPRRFDVGEIEPYTLVMLPGITNQRGDTLGQLHFDIPKNAAKKASFVVDYLIDPARILDALPLLNAKSTANNAYFQDIFETRTLLANRPVQKLSKGTAVRRTNPRITIEYCEPPRICCPCVDFTILKVGKEIEVHDVVVKGYAC